MLPWFFSLDHTNYARWLTVAHTDLQNLPKYSELYAEFEKGKFTVNKIGRSFSNMGKDQTHKQLNNIIKDDGGAVGLFDNSQAILQWAISGSNNQQNAQHRRRIKKEKQASWIKTQNLSN